ncbi:serine protease SP24D-like [Uranotaenia lowii]|uniref:serine protease SP24D-like n=1 Tax=Uranotaenia lowii TaxID=190385 RepID=UPI0024793D81|nr:serine protease SP24D-like [Uranotaenia lowii]
MSRVVICVLLFASILAAAQGYALRIVGGQFAEEKQFPYQVALFIGGNFSCGGSIIESRWILTAAHCVNNGPVENDTLTVYAGSPHLEKDGVFLNAEHVYHYPGSEGVMHDIALIKLEKAITFGATMQKIELYTEELPVNSTVTISGHGKTGQTEEYSVLLKYNTMYRVDQTECDEMTGGAKSPGLICFNNVEDNGICSGDSGGPAVFEGKQVGVANFALGRCGSVRPDYYARVQYYAKWISETMSKND